MTLKMPLQIFGGFGLVTAILLGVVIFFSSVESRYECAGTFSAKEITSKSKVFIKIERYRWWVKLWSPSDGALWLEVPNQLFDYYPMLTKVGDQLQISRSKDELKGLWGYYSLLSNNLTLETSIGTFSGQCTKPND